MWSRVWCSCLLSGCAAVGCLGSGSLRAAEPATQRIAPSAQGTQLVPSRPPQGRKWKLVWSDEFNGAELDRTKWDFRLYMMHQRHKTWTEDAASLDGKVAWRVDGPVSHREEFILISTECNGYRQGGPAPELKKAKLPDYFVVDYVRVFDEVDEPTGRDCR